MKTVYLAGPISHCSYATCTSWRDEAETALKAWGIKGLSPMRGKDFLKDVACFSQRCDAYSDNPLSTPRGIMTRDRYDATHCDVLLVNLIGAQKVSIGTTMEIAWADARRTPIVLMIEADGSNVHEHSMIHEAIGYRTDNLADAVEITRLILGATERAKAPVFEPGAFFSVQRGTGEGITRATITRIDASEAYAFGISEGPAL